MFGKPCFQTFRTLSELFPNFLTQKQCFLTLKLKLCIVFFKIFEIDIHFWIKNNFFTNFFAKISQVWKFHFFPKNFQNSQKQKVWNFFTNLFAKILWVQKFHFFPKNFWTLTVEHFRNSRKRKVWKIPSNAGPYPTRHQINLHVKNCFFND